MMIPQHELHYVQYNIEQEDLSDAEQQQNHNYLDGSLSPGRKCIVNGFISASAKRFCLEFRSAEHNDGHIALRFKPMFDLGYVERTAMTESRGGGSEPINDGGMPFRIGHKFKLEFLCRPNDIMISVDGKKFCEHVHRMPPDLIERLYIKNLHSGVHIEEVETVDDNDSLQACEGNTRQNKLNERCSDMSSPNLAAWKQMQEALKNINDSMNDEYELFAKFIASTLRKFNDPVKRIVVMNDIHHLICRASMKDRLGQ